MERLHRVHQTLHTHNRICHRRRISVTSIRPHMKRRPVRVTLTRTPTIKRPKHSIPNIQCSDATHPTRWATTKQFYKTDCESGVIDQDIIFLILIRFCWSRRISAISYVSFTQVLLTKIKPAKITNCIYGARCRYYSIDLYVAACVLLILFRKLSDQNITLHDNWIDKLPLNCRRLSSLIIYLTLIVSTISITNIKKKKMYFRCANRTIVVVVVVYLYVTKYNFTQ